MTFLLGGGGAVGTAALGSFGGSMFGGQALPARSALSLQVGEVWRCRGGGRWRIVEHDLALSEWVAQAIDGPMLWRYRDDGTTAGRPWQQPNAMDLVERCSE